MWRHNSSFVVPVYWICAIELHCCVCWQKSLHKQRQMTRIGPVYIYRFSRIVCCLIFALLINFIHKVIWEFQKIKSSSFFRLKIISSCLISKSSDFISLLTAFVSFAREAKKKAVPYIITIDPLSIIGHTR